MPFETMEAGHRRVAVIGGGIAGLAAAWQLCTDASVVIYEAAPRLGGHARTVVAGKRGDQPVDTGFIVFNRVNYPHLTALFEKLGVPVAESHMSFGASIRGGWMEYGLDTLDTLFATRRNVVDPRFLRMVRDLMHFNTHAPTAVEGKPAMTIGGLCDALRLGQWFRDHYLTPFSGAIWSTPTTGILDFPAQALVQFFQNHALMGVYGQHQWYTVQGGSVEYVRRLHDHLARAGVDIRLKAAVQSVERVGDAVLVKAAGAGIEMYDDVIFATHADDTLAILADPSPDERRWLGQVRYQPNHAVLHSDSRLMPKRRKVWSSWNYVEPPEGRGDRIDLTYWMNSLQPIPKDDPLFVTLNSRQPIDPATVHDEVTFRHPVYDLGTLQAQTELRAMNGTRATWFCGAWMKNGFHEDGFASAVDVVQAMRSRPEVPAAA
jgi:predicted NAD/FAD-binding protein